MPDIWLLWAARCWNNLAASSGLQQRVALDAVHLLCICIPHRGPALRLCGMPAQAWWLHCGMLAMT